MRVAFLAVVLGVFGAANPVSAQIGQRVRVEQASFEIPAVLDELSYEPKTVEPPAATALPMLPPMTLLAAPPASPAKPIRLKVERPKPALQMRTADGTFWLHSAAFAGSMALDAWSTSRLVNFYRKNVNSPIEVPGICTETNRSLGRTPTDARIAGYFAAWTGGEVAATYLLKKVTWHFKPQWARESWRAPMTYFTALHGFWGLRNLNNCR